MSALQRKFGDEWFKRIENEEGKSGGLNIEGISAYHKPGSKLVWGLRSPLFGDDFAKPIDYSGTNSDKNLVKYLYTGKAIIALVDNPFNGSPSFTFETIDLMGHGIRGIEWIPAMNAYVIIGGRVFKANDYSLWIWNPDSASLVKLDLDGFSALCRPESVIQLTENGNNYLVILSEDSGGACENAPFTFIKAEIVTKE